MRIARMFATLAITYAFLASTVDAGVITFGSGANQFDMEFVEIGSPGNPADTTGNPSSAGAVGYTYNMGKHEVSREMINKANAEGSLGITLDSMIFVTGGARDAMPATGVSWFEAATFVNWLNTSQGFQAAYKFYGNDFQLWSSAEAWDLDGQNLFRHKDAHYSEERGQAKIKDQNVKESRCWLDLGVVCGARAAIREHRGVRIGIPAGQSMRARADLQTVLAEEHQ